MLLAPVSDGGKKKESESSGVGRENLSRLLTKLMLIGSWRLPAYLPAPLTGPVVDMPRIN